MCETLEGYIPSRTGVNRLVIYSHTIEIRKNAFVMRISKTWNTLLESIVTVLYLRTALTAGTAKASEI